MVVGMSEQPVQVVGFNGGDDEPGGRSPPPVWVIVVVVLSVFAGGWLLVPQGSNDSDSATGSTLLLTTSTTPSASPDEASVATSTTSSPTAAAPVQSVYGNPPAAVVAETPHELAGYVAVTSPDDAPFGQGTVWVFRPGGSLVSRSDNAISRFAGEYPMLITAGYLTLAGRILDIDLVEPPISLWTVGSVIPGSSPGFVWLERRVERTTGDSLWVSPVDVESLTVGERIEVTDLFSRPIVGVADGLIVVPLEQPSSHSADELAFWSPTDGLAPLDLPGEIDTVVAASGDVVVVASTGRVRFLDIASGEYVGSVELLDIRGPVTSACLSPDRQHVIVVGWNGKAVVGNTTTGEAIDLEAIEPLEPSEYGDESSIDYDLSSIQPEHGIGWTTDDQVVVIAEHQGAKHIVGLDITTGERFHVATLDGPEVWWLTASGTMC
jgi:hypothetical protein